MARKNGFIVSQKQAASNPSKPAFFINNFYILDDKVYFDYFFYEEALEEDVYKVILHIPDAKPREKQMKMPALPAGRYQGEPLDLWMD
jgi:hypothetical protein